MRLVMQRQAPRSGEPALPGVRNRVQAPMDTTEIGSKTNSSTQLSTFRLIPEVEVKLTCVFMAKRAQSFVLRYAINELSIGKARRGRELVFPG